MGLCTAQVASLTQAEYFWDTDPGEGGGTAITALDGNFNSAFEQIAIYGLGAPGTGLHKFCVRVKDNQGAWSPVFTNIVRMEPSTTPAPVSLIQAEYFWDADPGEGSATPLLATDQNLDSAFERVAVYGLNAPSTGMHKFSVRIKDNQGVWSPAFTNIVNVESTTTPTTVTLTQAEYFWDADPGEGNATPLLATDQTFDSSFEKVAVYGLNAPSTGMHRFSVRMKDNQGVWGPAFTNIINVESTTTPTPVNLAQAEYFWDNDPGEGNATPFAAADGNFNSTYERLAQSNIPLVGAIGLHTFNVRVKDNQNAWGPVFRNVVYFETAFLSNADFTSNLITVFPNPVRNILNLSAEKEMTKVSVFSLLGQEVIAKNIGSTEGSLDFSDLAAGTYIVKIQADNQFKTLKVIKQ